MAAPPLGGTFLSTMALLEHPCERTHAFNTTITFDALLPCRNNHANSPIICNVRYIECAGDHVWQGIYQLFLQVRELLLRVASAHLPLA